MSGMETLAGSFSSCTCMSARKCMCTVRGSHTRTKDSIGTYGAHLCVDAQNTALPAPEVRSCQNCKPKSITFLLCCFNYLSLTCSLKHLNSPVTPCLLPSVTPCLPPGVAFPFTLPLLLSRLWLWWHWLTFLRVYCAPDTVLDTLQVLIHLIFLVISHSRCYNFCFSDRA